MESIRLHLESWHFAEGHDEQDRERHGPAFVERDKDVGDAISGLEGDGCRCESRGS